MPDNVELYCPKDFNLGDYREDHCNVGGIPCPDPKPVDPETVVQVGCGPCGRFWGIPIASIMKGKAQSFHQCSRSECAAKLLVPQVDSFVSKLEPAPPVLDIDIAQGESGTLEDLGNLTLPETTLFKPAPKPASKRK
jgi:hypothetical protein